MLFDPILRKRVYAILRQAEKEWNFYRQGITDSEEQSIISWINSKFDEVASRPQRVQPSGWLASGFVWQGTPLYPIYRECKVKLGGALDIEIEEKAGQIYGLYVSLTLADYRDETWFFVKDDKYKAHGVSIKSRIYFLATD